MQSSDVSLDELLSPIRDDARHVSQFLARLGASDGEYLHHVIQTLLVRHENPLTAGIALLVSRAFVGSVPDSVLRYAAAVQIVEVAGLAHRQILRGNPLVPAEQPAIDLHLVVLAGDYLYSQAAFITAGLEDLTVMRLLAEVIKEQCRGEVARERGKASSGLSGTLYALAAVGTGHLIGCDDERLEELRDFALVLQHGAASEPDRGVPSVTVRDLLPSAANSQYRRSLLAVSASLLGLATDRQSLLDDVEQGDLAYQQGGRDP